MSFPANNLSDEEFEQWRYVKDEFADSVAEALLKSPHAHEVYQALGKIVKNNDPVDIHLFEYTNIGQGCDENGNLLRHDTDDEHVRLVGLMSDYFNDLSLMPVRGVEKTVIENGAAIYYNYVMSATIALAVRSLLKQYAAFRATNVLVFTKLLNRYPHRRIIETMQFVMDVMDPNGFKPDGHAIRAIQKLRLVHAMIRARIKFADQRAKELENVNDADKSDAEKQLKRWDMSWGEPINQQDMIFAVHTFSVEVIDGMVASGINLHESEKESYYATWHYIGRALGVKDEINPMTYEDGKIMQERIYKKEFVAPNPNATVLSDPLIEFMTQILPFKPVKKHIYSVVKLYNDPKDYEPIFKNILKIDLSEANDHFTHQIKLLSGLLRFFIWLRFSFVPRDKKHQVYFSNAIRHYNMMQRIVDLEKTWSDKHFRISDGFGDRFAIEDSRIKPKNKFHLLLDKIIKFFFNRMIRRHSKKKAVN